jgi:putative ATPase
LTYSCCSNICADCWQIHRFSKSQQDVFLGPVEAGQVTLIGATTENPSFKVANALLSRCRTFTLAKLTDDGIIGILKRALLREVPGLPTPSCSPPSGDQQEPKADDTAVLEAELTSYHLLTDDNYSLVRYLATFADGDARTGLNLLELALDLCKRPGVTADDIKKSLTQTLVVSDRLVKQLDSRSSFRFCWRIRKFCFLRRR